MRDEEFSEDERFESMIEVPSVCRYDWAYRRKEREFAQLYKLDKPFYWHEDISIDWGGDNYQEVKSLPDNYVGEWSEFYPFKCLSDNLKLKFLKDFRSWGMSQILHGEQGALLVASQLVISAPTLASKKFSAIQVSDELRHVNAFNKYIELRFGTLHEVSNSLKSLLDMILMESRWDVKLIGMQLVIENLAMSNFVDMKRTICDPILQKILTYVLADEARHISFGMTALSDSQELSDYELKYRNQFAVEAINIAKNNIFPVEIWESYGWDIDLAGNYFLETKSFQKFSGYFREKIIPHIRKVGISVEI